MGKLKEISIVNRSQTGFDSISLDPKHKFDPTLDIRHILHGNSASR